MPHAFRKIRITDLHVHVAFPSISQRRCVKSLQDVEFTKRETTQADLEV